MEIARVLYLRVWTSKLQASQLPFTCPGAERVRATREAMYQGLLPVASDAVDPLFYLTPL
jgi:hypothetical protein